MSRRGYESSEIYEERERDYYEPSSHGRRNRTVYAEDIEIHDRRRAPERDRQPEFLREDYGRREAGALVLREDKREKSRERPRRRDVEVDETVISRGPRERERLRERDFVEDEVIVARAGRDRPRERREKFVERDEFEREIVYRPRERDPPPQQVRSEREEFVYRRDRERDYEREVPPPPIRSEKEEYVFRAPKARQPSPEPERERTEISIREKSRGPPRERDYRDDEGRTEISIRERSRGPARERGYREEEDIIIRRDEKSKGPSRERDRGFDEEVIIDRDRRRPRAASYERDSLTISSGDRERPRAKSRGDFRGEEETVIIKRGEGKPRPRTPPRDEEQIIIRRSERESRPRSPPREEEQIIIRRDEGKSRAASSGHFDEEDITFRRGTGERERFRERSRETYKGDYDDITFKHDDNNGRHKDEIIIRRNEKSPSPEPIVIPEPPRAPEPTRAPPIVQEIITHHRHIDHGFERAPEPPPRARTPPPRARTPPPPPRPRSPSPVRDERIEIRHSGSRNGRQYDEDIVFERETGGRRRLDGVRRSERHEEPPVVEESRELMVVDTRDRGRRFEAEKPKKDRMWTEITKDLVSEEALREAGKEYEETDQFYYVMEYLRYEDVLALVELTDDIKRDRRERIREIQAERDFVERPRRPLALPPPPWDEERVVEREVIYGPPRRHR